jgi:hypothetical protein
MYILYGCLIEHIVPILCILHAGSFKRKKSSFVQDLTDVSKKGAKRMRYEYVFICCNYGIILFVRAELISQRYGGVNVNRWK